jgi:hypothetical protein
MIAIKETQTVQDLANYLKEFHASLDAQKEAKEIKAVKKLLSEGKSNAKTAKNELKSYIMYLSPANQNSFGKTVCTKASEGCTIGCLVTTYRMSWSSNIAARIRKTDFYFADRKAFCEMLFSELSEISRKAVKGKYKVAIRLNGTSDLDFFAIVKNRIGKDLLALENLVFYDYTKLIGKVLKYQDAIKAGKYYLTFSRSENNWAECLQALALNVNVAVVFDKKKPLPETFEGFQVINGDLSDIEMLSNAGKILGLKAKGKAVKDQTGFVIR